MVARTRLAYPPSFDDVVGLPVLSEGVVGSEHLDSNHRVDIRHYLDWADSAVAEWCALLGLDAAEGASADCIQYLAQYYFDHRQDMLLGDRFSAHLRIVGRRRRGVHLVVYLLNLDTECLSFVSEVLALNVEVRSRRTAALPSEISSALDDQIAEESMLVWPATANQLTRSSGGT